MVHVVGERMKVENILYCCVRVKYALSPVTSQRAPHYLERLEEQKKGNSSSVRCLLWPCLQVETLESEICRQIYLVVLVVPNSPALSSLWRHCAPLRIMRLETSRQVLAVVDPILTYLTSTLNGSTWHAAMKPPNRSSG